MQQNKLLRIIPGGSDPENFDLSKDGKQLYISNEDISSLSIVDIATATVVKTIKMGGQPEGVKTSPDGKSVFVTSEEDGTITIFDPVAGNRFRPSRWGIVLAQLPLCLTVNALTSTPRTTGASC